MRFPVSRSWLAAAGIALLCSATREAGSAQLRLTLPPVERDRTTLVWARDFAASSLALVTFDQPSRTVRLARGNVRLEMPLDARTVRLNDVAVQAPTPARLIGGRVMIPASFAAKALGLSPVAITIRREFHGAPPPRMIQGRVLYAGRPLAGVVLRLVHADDFTFVPQLRASTDDKGRYSFAGVPDGAYRVYAYVGDNPGHFNRVTSRLDISGDSVEAPDINMGRVIEARDPPAGAILSPTREFVFTWLPCPHAAGYLFSVTDSATNEETFSRITTEPHVAVDVTRMSAGRRYEWRVTATDAAGGFLGGSPGAGADPFTFTLAVD